MNLRKTLNKARFTQWTNILCQLRPSLTPEEISNLIPWRYKFVTALRDDKVVGVGAYYPTASLIKGKFNYLADLVVDTQYRGKGVGGEMMEEILETNLPCELDSGLEKVDAHRFYLNLGLTHTAYAVRPPISVLATLSDLPLKPTYLINDEKDLRAQSQEKQTHIQAFIDRNANISYQANLQAFMRSNPDHHLLALKDEADEIEGVLLYELQNRLSFGGNCFHVTDLIVKRGSGAEKRQNALLLSLLQQAKNYNADDSSSPIRTVVVEMTEEEVGKHEILKGGNVYKAPDVKKMNINAFFSVSAKHFVKLGNISNKDHLPTGNWYRKIIC